MRRITSYIIIFFIYVFAFLTGFIFFSILKFNYLINIIISDLIATVVVWLSGVILNNSSVYDPYWSVAPMIMVPLFIKELNIGAWLMLIAIFYWGFRLTINWAYTFKGLGFQDWRYIHFKTNFPRLWSLINFFGINLFPTLVVILVMLPSFKYFEYSNNINLLTIFGFLICLLSVTIQLISDLQMHRFRINNSGQVNDTGLWKYSRHPNYLGEICMWWGIYIMAISVSINNYLYFIGPLVNTLMFIFISIPLMENRQLERKVDYLEYKNSTSCLLLLPKKKESIIEQEKFS